MFEWITNNYDYILFGIVDVEEAANQAIEDWQLAKSKLWVSGWVKTVATHLNASVQKAVQCMKAKNGLWAKSGQAKQSKLQSTHCIGARAAQAGWANSDPRMTLGT